MPLCTAHLTELVLLIVPTQVDQYDSSWFLPMPAFYLNESFADIAAIDTVDVARKESASFDAINPGSSSGLRFARRSDRSFRGNL
jgi:hypothetical protein